MNRMRSVILATALASLALPSFVLSLRAAPPPADTTLGYYRFPALAGDSVVFTAEGDLWRVPIAGGTAQRLTSHPAEESHPAVSPDGKTLAYSAAYEGPTEVYTMSLDLV